MNMWYVFALVIGIVVFFLILVIAFVRLPPAQIYTVPVIDKVVVGKYTECVVQIDNERRVTVERPCTYLIGEIINVEKYSSNSVDVKD